MSGLLVRILTAGPDDFRQPRSLSSRRARGSWRRAAGGGRRCRWSISTARRAV